MVSTSPTICRGLAISISLRRWTCSFFWTTYNFQKNSSINRVRVLAPNGAKWLTVPVSYRFGDLINNVKPAQADWPSRHLDTLFNYYRSAPSFDSVWPRFQEYYAGLSDTDLASINRYLVETIASDLGLSPKFMTSSKIPIESLSSEDRLVALVAAVDPEGVYLSGSGGAKYQDSAKFEAAGLKLEYADCEHPTYCQATPTLTDSLSIVDALFNLGRDGTAKLLSMGPER